MKRLSSLVLGVLISALLAGNAAAQWNVARFDTYRSRAYTTFGLDPAFVASMGYGRVLTLVGHDFQLSGDAALAAAHMDVRDFRGRLGAQTSLARWRSVHLTGSATFITRGTENAIYRGFNFGSDFTGTLGVYRHSWFTAGEFGFDKAIITHVTHSDWYRKHYFPEAKDGWYLDAGGTYHFGVAGGVALGGKEVVARFGWSRTEEWNDITPPVYGSLGIGFGF